MEELLRDYITLLPAGRKLKALCPFHAEKTPSFQVDVEKQFYYCFGCQEGGDLFRFVQKVHHIEFPEALELLARRAGVTLETDSKGGSRGTLVKLYDALLLAKDFYRRFLLEANEAQPAREYLKRRGIDPALWEKFGLGFSPGEWDRLVREALRQGVAPEILEQAGLARKKSEQRSDGAYPTNRPVPPPTNRAVPPPTNRPVTPPTNRPVASPTNHAVASPTNHPSSSAYYDYFRGRIMFPVTDPQNRVIGFGARTLGDDVPKYLNTPKTALFDKSKVLYAMPQARAGIQKEGRIGIVEGYTDAIMAHQAGLDFFVASLGTAFTQENARRLSRIAPRALLVFDGDAAGQKASERSLELLVAENLDVRIYTVKDGKDPCDAISLLGGEEFRRRLEEESVGIFEFKWRRTMESEGARNSGPGAQARALDDFLGLLARVPNVVARKLYSREFGERVGISEEDIEARLKVVSRRASPSAPRSPVPRPPVLRTAGTSLPGMTASGGVPETGSRKSSQEASLGTTGLAKLVLECILALPHKGNVLWAQVPKDLFQSPPLLKLAQSIEGQLEGDGLSPARLAQEVVDFEASGILLGLLSRLEDENGKPACDYEEVWINVQRDLSRYVKRKRAEELKDLMAAEKAAARSAIVDTTAPHGASCSGAASGKALVETEVLQSLRREYFETLRELKR